MKGTIYIINTITLLLSVRVLFVKSQAPEINGVIKCGGVFRGTEEGKVSSPGYPEENYIPDLNCTYVIIAPEKHVVTYKSIVVDLEDPDAHDGKCIYDVLKIYDGDALSKEVCGLEEIYLNATTTNKLKFIFTSDFATESSGFEIEWRIVNPEDRTPTFNCNFDEAIPLCAGWINYAKSYKWLFTNGFTPSANTGPISDHTTLSPKGRYAYIEGSKVQHNTTAILRSPPVTEAGIYCLTFWYHMFGEGIGGLAVQKIEHDGNASTIVEFHGEKGDKWLKGQYIITLINPDATIAFEARRGAKYTSDLAIDDIHLSKNICPEASESENPTEPVDIDGDETALPTFFSIIFNPLSCPSNLESSFCPSDCNLSCDNAGTFGESVLCTPACIGQCACPNDLPILHEGRCIDYASCPQFVGMMETSAETTTQTEPTTTTRTYDIYDFLARKISEAIQTVLSAAKAKRGQ